MPTLVGSPEPAARRKDPARGPTRPGVPDATIAGAVTLSGDDLAGLSFFALFAVVLPADTAVFARLPRVRGWTAAH